MEIKHYCLVCKAVKPFTQGSNKSIFSCTGCCTAIHFCQRCDAGLETQAEIDNTVCESCCIDLYEEQQRRREQRWLERV